MYSYRKNYNVSVYINIIIIYTYLFFNFFNELFPNLVHIL